MSQESPPSTGQPLDNNLQFAICNLQFAISAHAIDLDLSVKPMSLPDFERRQEVGVREARLLGEPPWVRSLGRLTLEVSTAGWRFPAPLAESPEPGSLRIFRPVCEQHAPAIQNPKSKIRNHVRLRPPSDAVLLKDRLLYLLQPPLENLLIVSFRQNGVWTTRTYDRNVFTRRQLQSRCGSRLFLSDDDKENRRYDGSGDTGRKEL